MTDEELIEKVAHSMWLAAGGHEYWKDVLEDDYYNGPGKQKCRAMAWAAIKTIRESK